MKRLLFLALILIPTLLMGCSEQEVYLFSYFKGNGEDGLHLAKSEDGRNWTSLKGDARSMYHYRWRWAVPYGVDGELDRKGYWLCFEQGSYHMVGAEVYPCNGARRGCA